MKIKSSLIAAAALFTTMSCAFAGNEVQIIPAPFPAVPKGWSQEIINNTVIYNAPLSETTNTIPTTIRLTYTRKTDNQNAVAFMDSYISRSKCEKSKEVAKNFFTTQCKSKDTYAVVIGEPSNMYLIELIGQYDAKAKNIINTYIKDITTGKHVFYDRTVGDQIR